MRRVVSRLRWQAAVAVLLCCAGSFLVAPGALAQPKPEPATKKAVGPVPEPQKPQAPTPTKPT